MHQNICTFEKNQIIVLAQILVTVAKNLIFSTEVIHLIFCFKIDLINDCTKRCRLKIPPIHKKNESTNNSKGIQVRDKEINLIVPSPAQIVLHLPPPP